MNKVPLLELNHVSYSYAEGQRALHDINVTIDSGDCIAVLGNNGAGKSTFFLTCNGILKPEEGSIRLHGEALTREKCDLIRLRKNIGIVFQDAENQIIASTVESEVSFGPMNLGLTKKIVSDRVSSALTQMNLLAYRLRAPHYLSGGEKKRVSIADILAMEPEAILLDEPTASLDPQNVLLLESILKQLTEAGITILIATHDVDFAYRVAKRAIVFHQSEIIADGKMTEIFENDAMIKKAGLQKPILFEVMQLLHQKTGLPFPLRNPPRNINELSACLDQYDSLE